jgi:hypothetical protein
VQTNFNVWSQHLAPERIFGKSVETGQPGNGFRRL